MKKEGKLQGKVALITGASRGIGAGIAERFANEGAKVVVNYHSSSAKANDLVAKIIETGGEAIAVQADMSDIAAIETLVAKTVAHFGKLDILVNNAGWAVLKELFEITPEQVKQQFDLNVTGMIFATQFAAKVMENNGRIINISSIAAKGGVGGSIYGATKAAMNSLTKSYAAELGHKGITVNAIAPAAIETDLYVEAGLVNYKDELIANTPLGRIGQVRDVAGAAAFLASEDAEWITGEILQVSGGRSL